MKKGKQASWNQQIVQRMIEADRRAAESVAQAREEARKSLKKAEEQADARVDQERQAAEKEAQQMVAEAEQASAGSSGAPSNATTGRMDLEQLKRDAGDHMDAAVDFLVAWVTLRDRIE